MGGRDAGAQHRDFLGQVGLASRAGEGSGGGFDPAASTTVWVDVNRADVYVEDGTNEKPFKTGGAAVARMLALAATEPGGALVFAPGDYAEDLAFAPPGTFALGVFGYGRQGQSRIRSFGFTPGVGTLQVAIDQLALGGLGGVTTPGALFVGGGAGALFMEIGSVDISRATAGSAVDVVAAGGSVSIRLAGAQVSTPGAGAAVVVGWTQRRGTFFGFGEIGGNDAPAVVLTDGAGCALDRFVLLVTDGGAAGAVDCLTAVGVPSVIALTNVRAEPKNAGNLLVVAGHTLILANIGIVTGDGTGGVFTAGGTVLISNVTNLAAGAPVPVLVSFAALVLPMTPGIQLSSLLVGGAPAALGTSLTADGAGGVSWV